MRHGCRCFMQVPSFISGLKVSFAEKRELHPLEGEFQPGSFAGCQMLYFVFLNLEKSQKTAVENHFTKSIQVVACKIKHLLLFFGEPPAPEPGVS